MNTPAITWRLRKIGCNLWSSMRAHATHDWLAIHATRAPIVGRAAVKPPGLKPPLADVRTADGHTTANVRRAPRAWLAALPLDGSRCYGSPLSAKQPG